jgi:hypothetical protein
MFHCLTFSCRCFTLHVSAYMAIFRRVGCFYFHIPEGICFAGFTCTWLPFARFHLWGGLNMRYYFLIMGIIIYYYYAILYCYGMCVFTYLCFFVVLFSSLILPYLLHVFVCLPFLVVLADGNITCKIHWNIAILCMEGWFLCRLYKNQGHRYFVCILSELILNPIMPWLLIIHTQQEATPQ